MHITGKMELPVENALRDPEVFIRDHMQHIEVALKVGQSNHSSLNLQRLPIYSTVSVSLCAAARYWSAGALEV